MVKEPHQFETKMKKLIILLCLVTFGCNNQKLQKQWTTQDGVVPDSITAIKIAEIIWVNVYGKSVLETKPFKASLKADSLWVVEGTLNAKDGGTPYLEIQKNNCKILKITHSK